MTTVNAPVSAFVKLLFGKKWFGAKMRMTETWDESTARQAHLCRKEYSVLAIDANESPRFVIEFNNDFAGIGFFDQLGREYLCYHFQEKEAGRLFLTMAVHREFEGLTRRIIRGTILAFKTDGTIVLEKLDFIENTTSTGPAEKPSDVSQNWETYPEFGEYNSIARVNRG
jgi:hypothetical protein